MPRYLGIDYLADALQQRKNMLSQMLLTIPSHLEYVDEYTHNGTVANRTRHIPWQKETPFKLSSKQPIDYLTQITDTRNKFQHPEPYSPEKTGDDFVPSSNPGSPLVSFDMWSDLEEDIVNYLINSFARDKEQFAPTNKNPDDDLMQDKLEELEHTDNLHVIRQKIPKISDLASRLKTKLVEDPLVLDSQGNLLEEKSVLRMDIQVPFDRENAKGKRQQDKEMFLKIQPSDNMNENDREIESVVSPVMPSKESLSMKETHRLLKLHESNEPEGEKPEVLLRQPAYADVETFIVGTETASKGISESKKTDFVKLNEGDEEYACNLLEDRQLLESPSHLPTVSENHSSKKFISSLERFKQSPEINSPPLTSNKVKQCVQNIWENEKFLFSEHLAMVLPVPSTSSRRKKDHSTTLTQVAMKKLILSKEYLDGKVELGIPWNPLAVSTRLMEHCQKNLQTVSTWSCEKQSRGEVLSQHQAISSYTRETFHKSTIRDEEIDGRLSRGVQPFSEKLIERDSGADCGKTQTSAAIVENHNTLPVISSTSNSPVTSISRSSSTSKFATEIGGNSEEREQQEPCFTQRTTRSASKQFSGGIDDFFLLREGQVDSLKSSNYGQCAPPKKVVKAVKVRPSVFTTEQSGLDSSTTGTNPTKEQSVGHECYAQQHSEHHALKRPYCHAQQRDITVELSDEFQEVLDELIGHVKPLLFRLQKNGAISQTKTLSNLNREYTRFVLKQAQMSLKEGEENSKQSHIYRMAVCLHSLVSSVDVLMQSGLEAAIAYLSSTQETYSSVLGGALESTRRYLFETHFAFQQQKILHPKLLKLVSIVAQWRKEQDTGTANAAIIIYSFPEKLTKEITETLSGLHGVQTLLYETAIEMNTMEEENGKLVVYVVNGLAITEDFPWGRFDYVLDYDLSGSITREELSHSTRLKTNITLKTMAKALMENQSIESVDISETQFQGEQDQYIFIGSEKVTQNKDLLHLLETCHNVLIYERRNSNTRPKDSLSKMCLQPDVMIDERTCIQLQLLPSLANENEYERLRDVVLSLSLKCQKCCIVMYSDKQPDYAFTGDVLRHLSLLFASFAHFQKSEFEVEILYSFTMEETAKLVRQIGDKARAQSIVWNNMEWPKRKWLTTEASAHEKFLLSLPCMNSFSAQVMLTAAPLAELLKMSQEELRETCPWIPPQTLTEFTKAANWCSELDGDLPVYSFARPLHQTTTHTAFTVEPSPCQISLAAASEINSSPDSMVSTSGSVEYTDYRLNDLPSLVVNTQQRQGTTRDAEADRIYYNNFPQGKPVTDDWSASVSEDRFNPVFNVTQREEAGPHFCPFSDIPAGETLEKEWSHSLMRNTSSKSWKDQVESDLRRCITEEKAPYSRYNHQLTEDYPVRSRYFSEISGSLQSRPEEISHLREGVTDYLTADKDIDVNNSVTNHTAMSSNFPSVRESTVRSSRQEGEDNFFPEAFWDKSRYSQRYHKPNDYSTHNVSQVSLGRALDTDIPSKRTRQAVRVLDLGNDGSRTLPTKVGIAQPQRRAFGPTVHHHLSMPSTSSQVMRENNVASKHKRFSLGIERSTNSTSRGAQQLGKGEREVPGIQPSPDETDDWSVFPSYLSTKRRKLTYEKIPGVESGQTKLVFKYDL